MLAAIDPGIALAVALGFTSVVGLIWGIYNTSKASETTALVLADKASKDYVGSLERRVERAEKRESDLETRLQACEEAKDLLLRTVKEKDR